MNLKCIKNEIETKFGIGYYENITPGKVYNILNFKNGNYWIWDDNGNQRGIPVECFISVEDFRNNRIDSILSDK